MARGADRGDRGRTRGAVEPVPPAATAGLVELEFPAARDSGTDIYGSAASASGRSRTLSGGHNGIDPESFPDSSPKFFNFLNSVFHLSLWSYDKSPVKILVPLSGKSKEDVIRMGLAMDVPFEVTWSCYWDKAVHCGICVSCRERREAFAKVGIEDPVEYEAPLGQSPGRSDPQGRPLSQKG